MVEFALGVAGTLMTGVVIWLLARSGRWIVDWFSVLDTKILISRGPVKTGGVPFIHDGAAKLYVRVTRTRFGRSEVLLSKSIVPGGYHECVTKPGRFEIGVYWTQILSDEGPYTRSEFTLPSGEHEFRVGLNEEQVFLQRLTVRDLPVENKTVSAGSVISDKP